MEFLDWLLAACLIPLAVAAVVSGLDDLVLDIWFFWDWTKRRNSGTRPPNAPSKRIAVFVPCWKEHAVIGRMLAHNLASIRYERFEFFVGVYPNDPETLAAVRELEQSSQRVHIAFVPHDGPTSKADCLNWIYRAMLAHERESGERFELIVTHDAEDVIHPDGLRSINAYSQHYDMVQVPVLPLATPAIQFTHGVYCDEFAEFQTKDVPARIGMGSFLPSNGVGTGYTRRAIEALEEAGQGRVFDPSCLTEDYDCGIRLYRLGMKQIFLPLNRRQGRILATREFFPRRFRQAVRQRTRWVTGIALQGWERHGWGGGLRCAYWFWRDRKGLLGNPLSVLGNLITIFGLCRWLSCSASGQPWILSTSAISEGSILWLKAALALQFWRLLVRAGCSARVYGWAFACWSPLRTVWSNWINAAATLKAIFGYFNAKLSRREHVWLKTEHAYPVFLQAAPIRSQAYSRGLAQVR